MVDVAKAAVWSLAMGEAGRPLEAGSTSRRHATVGSLPNRGLTACHEDIGQT